MIARNSSGPGFRLDILLGCCIIGIGIVIAGTIIAGRIPQVLSANVEMSSAQPVEESEWLSEFEAASYLRMDENSLRNYVGSGRMDGTFTTLEGGPVFSREKLRLWMAERIENQGQAR